LQRLRHLEGDAVGVPALHGVGDDLQQPLVDGQHEAARLRAPARAADEAVVLGRETDEVELLHRGPRP
jgi:hypothetical protein